MGHSDNYGGKNNGIYGYISELVRQMQEKNVSAEYIILYNSQDFGLFTNPFTK